MNKRLLVALIIIALVALLVWMFPGSVDGSDDKMRLFYVTLLAIVVGGGVIASHYTALPKLLKHGAAWLVIFIILITGYAYRQELSDSRILGALIPSRPVMQADGSFMIQKANDGHFYMRALVNGKEVNFLVDTGASDIVLDPTDAKRVGFALNQLQFTKRYATANGFVLGAPVTLGSFKVGEIILHSMPASVNQVAMSHSLLGMRFFERFGGIEIRGDRLIVNP